MVFTETTKIAHNSKFQPIETKLCPCNSKTWV